MMPADEYSLPALHGGTRRGDKRKRGKKKRRMHPWKDTQICTQGIVKFKCEHLANPPKKRDMLEVDV